MAVQVYGCNHVAIEFGDIKKAIAFYQDVFGLEKMKNASAARDGRREKPWL